MTKQAGLTQMRRIPTPVALTIGILFGFLFSRVLPWNTVSYTHFTRYSTKTLL